MSVSAKSPLLARLRGPGITAPRQSPPRAAEIAQRASAGREEHRRHRRAWIASL